MDQDKTLRCGVYLRVSTTEQVEKFGLDYQLSDCKSLIQLKRWELADIYKDEGISGSLSDNHRPELKRLLDDAQHNKIDCVVVYSIDRLSRDMEFLLSVLRRLKEYGVVFASTREMFDSSTSTGELALNMMGCLAQFERKNIRERMDKGREEKRKKSGWICGVAPFGYYYNKHSKAIEILKPEAEIVKLIFELREKEKLSFQKICDRLEQMLIPTRTGDTKWNKATINKILKRKENYEGGLIKNNVNDIRWPKII